MAVTVECQINEASKFSDSIRAMEWQQQQLTTSEGALARFVRVLMRTPRRIDSLKDMPINILFGFQQTAKPATNPNAKLNRATGNNMPR
ncbi:hypothetical protein Tcan_13113 [Toxocara canis]|uniref:Uncharacterized protein n=1 Tax=Toxocara canis TaxID=6265 RepID=A0A0B2UT98_TOXCA|nr:hypothetical protein Tcan_13113 [Toxocara canis]